MSLRQGDSVEVAIVAAAAILVGAVLQRLSGTGVGLIVAPALAMVMGPVVGVLTTNATTVVSAFLIMLAVRRDIEWRRFAPIGTAAVLGALPGALVVAALPVAWLQVFIGTMVLLALATTFGLPRLPAWTGMTTAMAAGVIGGFLNTTAGVSAPAMVIYAKLSRWEQTAFAATLQPIYLTMGALSVAIKLILGVADPRSLPAAWFWPMMVIVVLIGVWIGGRLSSRVSSSKARRIAVILAGLGGVVTLLRGLVAVA